MSFSRRAFTPLEKVEILKRHLLERVPVSQLCLEFDIAPNIFHQWLDQFFRGGAMIFQGAGRGRPRKTGTDVRVHQLERKVAEQSQVISELMSDHVALKKSLGQS